MNIEIIKKTIERIESRLSKELWLDFDIMSFDGRTLLITGTIDRTYKHMIEIEFKEVFGIFALTEWTWDKKENTKVLDVLTDGKERRELNDKYLNSIQKSQVVFFL